VEAVLIILLVLLTALVGFVVYLLMNQKPQGTGEGVQLLNDRIAELQRLMSDSTSRVQESVKTQLSESFRLIRDVTEGLTKLDETNKQVVSFADQLQNLQDILKNPKGRGALGEFYLETVLRDVLPEGTYQLQYEFQNGEKVDAVVIAKDQIIPIDAKFSLENYNRFAEARDPVEKTRLEKVFVNDLKLRIKETSKYIRPDEKTLGFAFMFIPSEGIYYDLLSNTVGALEDENILQKAYREYKVIIISPTTLLAYLQTVLQGLKSLQIEEKIHDVIKNVGELGKHLGAYREYQNKLGNALGTVVNHYNASEKEFKKIDKDVLKITGTAVGVETSLIDGPVRE
jgi:DNA recombination protein RmuC